MAFFFGTLPTLIAGGWYVVMSSIVGTDNIVQGNRDETLKHEEAGSDWPINPRGLSSRGLGQTLCTPSSRNVPLCDYWSVENDPIIGRAAPPSGRYRHPHADTRKRGPPEYAGVGPAEVPDWALPLPSSLWNLTSSKSNWTNAAMAKRSENQARFARIDAPTLLRFNFSQLSDAEMEKYFDGGDNGVQLEVHLDMPAHSERDLKVEATVHPARLRLGDEVMEAEWKVQPSNGDGLIHGALSFQPSDLAFPLEAAFTLVNHTSADAEVKNKFADIASTVKDFTARHDAAEMVEFGATKAFDELEKFVDGLDGEKKFEGTYDVKLNA